MEEERTAREEEEAEKQATEQKIKEDFGDTNSQWEKDKKEMQNMAAQQQADGERAVVKEDTPAKAPGLQADGAQADGAQADGAKADGAKPDGAKVADVVKGAA